MGPGDPSDGVRKLKIKGLSGAVEQFKKRLGSTRLLFFLSYALFLFTYFLYTLFFWWGAGRLATLSCTGEGNGSPLQCPCLENPRDGSLVGCHLWGHTESDTTDVT